MMFYVSYFLYIRAKFSFKANDTTKTKVFPIALQIKIIGVATFLYKRKKGRLAKNVENHWFKRTQYIYIPKQRQNYW